jgi:hypothetical protein
VRDIPERHRVRRASVVVRAFTQPGRERRARIRRPLYTIIEFCEVERMSRSALYKLWAQGKGPRFYFVGNTRRITAQARLDYHRDREAAAAVEMAAKP